MQALLTRECVAKGFGIRRLDGAQPGDEALLVLDRDAVEALRRGLAAASRTEWRSQAPLSIVAPLAANALFDLNPSCVDMLR